MFGIIRPNRPQLICKGKKRPFFQWECLKFRSGKLVRMIVDVRRRWRRRCWLVSSIGTTEILSHVFIWGETEKSGGGADRNRGERLLSVAHPSTGSGSDPVLWLSPPPQRLSVLPPLHPFAAGMATARRRPATQRCLLIGAEETAAPRLQEGHCSLGSAQRSSCPDRTCACTCTQLLPRLQQNRAIMESSDLNLRLDSSGPFPGRRSEAVAAAALAPDPDGGPSRRHSQTARQPWCC